MLGGWVFLDQQVLFNVHLLVAHLLSQIVTLPEEGRLGQFIHPFQFLDFLQSASTQLAGHKLDRKLVVSLVVVAEVHCLSPWHILHISKTFFFVSIGMNAKCSHIHFLQVAGLNRVHYDSQEGVCASLEKLLRVDVNS